MKPERLNFLILVIFLVALTASAMYANASDPAGQWSRCVNQTGKEIIVDGPRCPKGWRKIY